MKKMLTFAIAMTLALVMSNVSFAQEEAAEAATEVVEIEAATVQESVAGFPGCVPCQPFPCRPFLRRACNPCFAAPCDAAPCNAAPCVAAPCRQAPCGMNAATCDLCGYPGYRATPIRSFFARIFAPRPYCGYDAYYGPTGFGYGCNSSPCAY